MTSDEIKALQKTGIDYYGNPLKVDGIDGNKTAWWRGIASLSQQRQDVIRLALGYHAVGMGETTGKNDGTFVDMLLAPSKLHNVPWCLALCSHVYRKCGVDWPKYHVSAYSALEWAKANNKLVLDPLPGDLCVYLHDKQPGDTQIKGHGEIVLASDDQFMYDVGGNISNQVRSGRRIRSPRMKFIQVMDTQHGTMTVPTGMMRIDALADR